jgi:hypothetical protein
MNPRSRKFIVSATLILVVVVVIIGALLSSN